MNLIPATQVVMHSRVFGQLATLTILVTTMVFRGGHLSPLHMGRALH